MTTKKNYMSSKECAKYRKRYVTILRLEATLIAVFIMFIMLALFYGGMLYERYG
ncbi:hypothetical protein [Methanobrevibacter sp.]|uniref:hypothetical protein n=1 Tax=Methanobrevibacter sp. TaxID=66852 RepID=UPI003D7E9FC4